MVFCILLGFFTKFFWVLKKKFRVFENIFVVFVENILGFGWEIFGFFQIFFWGFCWIDLGFLLDKI